MTAKKRSIVEGKLIERSNRFLALVNINGRAVEAHLPNPGRMHEFMVQGRTVFLRERISATRKTDYDVIGVLYNGIKVSIDSTLPNRFLRDLLEKHALPYFSGYTKIKSEPSYDGGRFDFRLEAEHHVTLVEVKSCTLVEDGRALFPDAPTIRGVKHMWHLSEALLNGTADQAAVVFVIQRPDAISFSPHDGNDPKFADALRDAYNLGVEVIPLTTQVINWKLRLKKRIPLILGPLKPFGT